MHGKRLISLAIAAVLTATVICTPVSAVDPDSKGSYSGNRCDTDPAVTGSSLFYVPLRDFMEALGVKAAVEWNAARRTACVTAPGLSLTVRVGDAYLTANDRCLYLGGESFVQNGKLLVPLRPLAKACGLETVWNEEERELELEGKYRPIQKGGEFYDEEELYWLSRIIYAEAGIEELEGMIAVGNVVLNRAARKYWPDSVYDVIFDQRFGVTQFTPVAAGTIYEEPSEMAVIAAKLALEGVKVAGDSLFFINEAVADGSWFQESCIYVTTIGRHSFYTQKVA